MDNVRGETWLADMHSHVESYVNGEISLEEARRLMLETSPKIRFGLFK